VGVGITAFGMRGVVVAALDLEVFHVGKTLFVYQVFSKASASAAGSAERKSRLATENA